MKVLIAEDNSDDRKILRYNLEHHGCEVIEAQDGQEGLELAATHKPDIIISDAMMPGMDGFRFLRAVKQDEILKSIPFIFYTAVYIGHREAELAISLGAEAYIIKPKEPDELWKELLEVCEEIKQKKEKPLTAELIREDEEFLRIYSQIVVKKLEDKVNDLEKEIKKRKLVEESLRQSEEKYRSIVENIYDFIYSAKPDGTITFITPNVSAWGYSPEEIVGHSLLEFLHPDDVEHVARDFQKTVTTGEEFPTVARLKRKDGKSLYIEEYGKVLREGEKVVRVTGSVRDITDRKKAEAERDRLFNFSIDMLCIAGFDGYFKQLNPAWEKTLGWTNEELTSKPYLEFVHPEDREATTNAAQNLEGGKIVITFENRYICKDGSYKWISWNAHPLVDEGLIFAVVRDVTGQKKMEQEIQERIQELENFYKMAVGRELRMKELKEKIKELEEEMPKNNQDER